MAPALTFDALLQRARELAGPGRRLLGLAGAPGAGKSTLAAALVSRLGPSARLIPLDGFHLANAELRRLGRRDRKGAIDTFDGAGYVNLLTRLARPGTEVVYAPAFDRTLDEAVAGAIAVGPEVSLVVTEGNYLLAEQAPWGGIKDLLGEVWYLRADEEQRLERLVARHCWFGLSEEQARRWVATVDQPNADAVAASAQRADLVVDIDDLDLGCGHAKGSSRLVDE